jgi:hypothetical protein
MGNPDTGSADTGGPPEHWLRLVESTRPGPPEHWLELVRRGAPHLLEGLELGPSRPRPPVVPRVPAAPRPVVPPVAPRREPAPVRGAVSEPQGRPRVRLMMPSHAAPSEPPRAESGPSSVQHSALVPASVPSTGPRAGEPPVSPSVREPPARQRPERGPATPVPEVRRGDAREGSLFPRETESTRAPASGAAGSASSHHRTEAPERTRSSRARGLSLRPVSESSFSTEGPRPVSVFDGRSDGFGNPGPSVPSPRPSPGGRGVIAPRAHVPDSLSSPSGSSTSAARASSFPIPEPSFRETPRSRETVRAEPSSAPDGAFPSDAPHPWPEPPELPSTESSDPLAVLRDFERLRRLEREQRGE